MGLPAIRGAILEEIVLYLLARVGYREIIAGEEGTRRGHSGLEVEGRGEWHQIDAFAAFDHSPAFMYPLRLMVEAKCYVASRPVGIETVRNAVGVLKDISENYFTPRLYSNHRDSIKFQQYNYHAAIFSTSGFTRGAERYAIAHQIFLIQYKDVHLFHPISQALLGIGNKHFKKTMLSRNNITNVSREAVRRLLRGDPLTDVMPFTRSGLKYLREQILNPLHAIGGSYFGMLQGKWPIHLLSETPLPLALFREQDVVKCKIYGRESKHWSFVPVDQREGSENWFRLEFDLPEEVLELVWSAQGDRIAIAQLKIEHFSFICVSGIIGNVRRQVILELDEGWINDYINKMREAANKQKTRHP
ncbi:MAG TPA: hypothetical protein PLV42_05550 [bacterium]|nr:hypothetical protein [bacterium]